eukprot:2499955-Heterocapsa_arctica.AAC.1
MRSINRSMCHHSLPSPGLRPWNLSPLELPGTSPCCRKHALRLSMTTQATLAGNIRAPLGPAGVIWAAFVLMNASMGA